MLDLTTDFGERAAQRLANEQIIWLTTVGPDQTPQPSPVWFLWDGATLLIYSRANTPKLRNIAANPKVALNFDGDGSGGNIVVLTGQAVVEEQAPADQVAAYLAKYQAGIARIGMTPESFLASYAIPMRVTPTRLRGH
jgi:PPOX class probable F420-dependent enzyme